MVSVRGRKLLIAVSLASIVHVDMAELEQRITVYDMSIDRYYSPLGKTVDHSPPNQVEGRALCTRDLITCTQLYHYLVLHL